jgi:hypothetical protein
VVPSVSVPIFLLTFLAKRVVSNPSIGLSDTPEISPTTGDLILALHLFSIATSPEKYKPEVCIVLENASLQLLMDSPTLIT